MHLKSTGHRPLAAALCGVLFAASLVIAPPASAQDVTIWSADLEAQTLNTAQDEFGCSESGPFNGQCANSNVLSDDDFKLHGTTYTIRRIEDDGSRLRLTLNSLLPENVLKILTLHVGDTELDFDDASVSSSNKRYTWSSSSPSWSSGDDVDLKITDASGPSLVKNTSLGDNDRDLSEDGHRSAQAFTAGTWARVTSIGIGIGDEVDDDVEVTLHKGGGSDPGDRLKTLENPSSITENSVNVFTVPDGGIVLEASKTYFVQVKTTSSDRVAVSVTDTDSDGNDEDAGRAKNWTIDNGSSTNRPSNGSWQASNQSMRIDVKGQVLLPPPTNPSARAVAPMRVTLEWDRTLPSLTGTIDRDDGYKIEWSADGNAPWTSLVNVTNQYVTDSDIWCVCFPTRYNDDTVTPGTTRHYRIKAVDDDEESAWSDVVSATTLALVDSDGGLILVGGVKSELDALNDQKVFQIGLERGEYRFRIGGDAPKHRVIVTGPGGTEIENFVLEAGNGLKPRITANNPGPHLVKISHGGGFGNAGGGRLKAGSFQFQLVPVSDPAVGTLRLPTPSALVAVLSTYGDVDRAEIAVQPGSAYAVRVRGTETGHGTAATPQIQRANPPGIYTDHHMGKPWVDGVTMSEICAEHGQSNRDCEEFQAFVIDLRGLTGAEQTWQIYVSPTARPDTRPYRVGTYRVELKELLPSQLQGVRMPLRAWFASPPDQHDGSTRIKVRVAFSDVVDESPRNVGEHGVSVDGGEVTSVRPVDGNASGAAGKRLAGGQDGEVVWEIEIEPDSLADVTVSLSAWRPCDETGAICTADGRVLSQGISTTVSGPDESSDDSGGEETSEEQVSDESSDDPGGEEQESLTARFEGMPAAHDGERAFTLRMAFSEPLSWMNGRRLREDVVAVAGGRATSASRVNRRRDLWQLTVEPDSPADVTVTLAAGAACDTPAAVCTADGRALSQGISTTVRGPAADEQESPATGQDQDPGQSVSEGDVDLPNDNTTPGRVAVGGSATGTIGIPEDQDRFAVDLEAGRTYRFDLTGRPGGGGTLRDTYFRAIYNSEGRYQSGSYNDDFDGGRDSRVTFTPTQSGTYYARVSGDRNETGTYTLSVTDVTPEQGAGPPAKPRGLEATVSHGQVVLTWDDPDDDSITGYMILRRVRVNDTGGDFSELVADTGSAATTYVDDTVAAETRYTYRIKAINEHGTSERSRWFHIDTPAAPQATFVESDDPDEQGGEDDPVGAPGGAGGTDKLVEPRDVPPARQGFEASNGNAQVTLTWTAPAADADVARHEYRFKTTGDYPAEWTEIDDSAPGEAHEDWVVVENLTNDVAYTFQLRAANIDGAGTAAEAGPVTPKSGFCGRTEQVRNKIMEQPPVKGVSDCAEVTAELLAGVTGLYLADDEIRSLQPGDFSDLEALETLYLNGNALVSLPAGVFSDLEALETLYLSGNEFSELPAGAFSDLTALQDLSLNHNALVSLPASVFSDLSALQDLALNHNALVSLPAGVFTGLTALDKLYLNNNALVLLPIDGFEDLSVLTHLILYHNELSSLPAGAFNGLTALDTLQLNSNKLTSLPAGVFSDLTKLELLWLSENELSSLPAGVFSDLEALTELRLNNNALSSLPADVFSGLTELQRLYLNVNELTSLPAGVFTGLTALTNLSLRSNKLGELPAGVFSDQTALGRLWLYDNDLTSLPAGVFSGLTALTTLELGDNPTTDRLLPLSVTLVTLENVGSDQVRQVRAEVRAGAPFTVDIPVTVANGMLDGDVTALRVEAGSVEGTAVTVTPTGTTEPVTVDIDLTLITQLILPGDHDGYIFVVEGADLPANATTSGVVVVKGSAARSDIAAPVAVRDDEGEITGYTFDTDWFAVELEAGRTYRIDMKGAIPTNDLTLRLPQINAIYDADGESLVNTFSRDESSSHHLFRVTFHAHAGGTYYIAASGESFEAGGYELRVIDITPASKPAVADGPPGLAPNAPNPFNASTLIPYRLDADGPVRLEIYNLLGQRVRALVDEAQTAGAYRVRWDARDGRGAAVATGVYFLRLHYPGGVQTRRMLYLE